MTTDDLPPPVLITNLASRRADGVVRSLDGTWRIIVDPYESGAIDILGNPNTRGYFRDFAPRHPGDRVEYDFDASPEIEVPGDWNTQRPELLYYEGTVWYRRHVDLDEPIESRAFLCLGGVNHTSRIFLDGREVGRHVGGFGDFAVELPPLAAGRHSLVVMVDNRREADRVPALRTDWWNFGGITRSVELVEVPSVFLRDAWVSMTADGAIVGGVTIDGDDDVARRIRIEIGDLPSVEIDAEPGPVTVLDPTAASAVERWHPGVPVLHEVRWTLLDDEGKALDRVVDEVGFRTVRVEGSQITVNDRPVYLRGISLHGEGPSGGRRSHGADDAAELLGWAVDLGANFVRLAHYQHDAAMTREADRRGLLAWTELPVYWGIAFDDDAVLANALDQADELVVRDRNRASVILLSAANETLPGPDRDAFITALLDRFRALDPTRLVTAALLTLPSSDPAVHIDDPLGDEVDVIGVNQYLGWYYGDRDAMADIRWTSAWGKPMVFSELGAGAKAGRHGGEDEIWTEEFQAAVYRAQIEMIGQQTECAGLSPWILKDFRTPLRVLPGIQDGYNRKGLVSEEGERKLAFDVLADWYRELAD